MGSRYKDGAPILPGENGLEALRSNLTSCPVGPAESEQIEARARTILRSVRCKIHHCEFYLTLRS